MALREAAGGDTNMFKAEQRQKKQARQLMKQQQQQKAKEKRQVNLFSFINTKLAGKLSNHLTLCSTLETNLILYG